MEADPGLSTQRYPFAYDPAEPFVSRLGEWVADVFYDILPESGFEVRDEQIFMAYQLERAYGDKKTIMAEAGVGTGKTLVYLLYAVCYARYTGKPAVIACADESLIEQLVKPGGDIAKLAEHLDLQVDARLGKSPDQYVCLNKLSAVRFADEDAPVIEEVYESLPDFVNTPGTLQAFHPYGDRKQYPHLNDRQWNKINWDPFQDCFVCPKRQRCGLTLSRDHYRRSKDIIICSHDYYMEHVWTYEARKREGQLPLLPDHSSVVFDEGHLLEEAALNALSYKLKHRIFEELVTRLLEGEIRETLAERVDEAIESSERLFRLLDTYTVAIPGSERKEVRVEAPLLQEIERLNSVLDAIGEELVFESGLFSLDGYQMRVVEEHLDMIQTALSLFRKEDGYICWAEESEEETTLSIMPRTVKEILNERVFNTGIPIVFSSATLSVDNSFRYVADSLGIDDFVSFSVASPYDYADKMQMKIAEQVLPGHVENENRLRDAAALLQESGGRALILFRTMEELRAFKQDIVHVPEAEGLRFMYEGDREISDLIAAFQQDEESVLCSVNLWEGLDVPGPSLSNVMIWSLPYPPQDPVFNAKRNASASPYEEIDLPYMLLRVKQGLGRLIRTSSDSGSAAILDESIYTQKEAKDRIAALLPEGVEWTTLAH
ncbi:ATP-dependent DNA helicase [Paenibacillus cucumis (ex Kampfer et al. 2016)]|uniref:ATP-dependent DNA helicase n=1 Tax=Paenibacillus cucumis (ex Kampfer et al. 2016) TaxID=1776858 RepID=A0ABS7KK85_9BACL|nr:ATP-dependent DNA helicase [Paenibacillus cucumis (ex Kampfer et al. 2016)]MBY0204572.1 ATP-dependent DNA helicase [Paenibacillus cucumis (ex Kampfer et al. 2016)]